MVPSNKFISTSLFVTNNCCVFIIAKFNCSSNAVEGTFPISL